MASSLLTAYTTWYEKSLASTYGALPWFALFFFAATTYVVGRFADSRKTLYQVLQLGLTICLFVAGAYLDFSPRITLTASLILLVLYPIQHGFGPPRDCEPSSYGLRCAAYTIIAVSTAIKLYNLATWPSLLNDYAAQTGVEAYSKFAQGALSWQSMRLTPHLHSGGASILHAPLVLLACKLFGYSTYAIRFAEVVGSIATLSFLWLLLQTLRLGSASVIALAAFALSAEHIATSRMGTFYSTSQALGLCIAWLSASLIDCNKLLSGRYLMGLVVAMLLLPFSYAPLAALFIFIPMSLWLTFPHRKLPVTHRRYVAILSACVLGLAFATWYRQAPFKTFKQAAPILATDTPVWFKTQTAVDFRAVQSPLTIAHNALGNITTTMLDAIVLRTNMEPAYTFASGVLLYLSVVGLAARRWRLASMYTLIGFLPIVATYPLLRRGILIRPLVPLVVVLYLREYWGLVVKTITNRFVRTVTLSALVALTCTIPVHGLYLYAKNNSPIGLAPSFGPEYARQFIDYLKHIPEDHSLVILNTGRSRWQYEMEFAELFMRNSHSETTITLKTITPGDSLVAILPPQRPLVIAFLNEKKREWLLPLIRQQLPDIEISEIVDGQTLVGWVATLSQ
jgi:hypothetical protein